MRLFRPWLIESCLLPAACFRIKTEEKVLCLTFDDGPDPISTLSILLIIEKFNIKSVFFCNGSSAMKYPELIARIRSGGHIIGNHGYSHLDGCMTSTKKYIENVKAADPFTSAKLFRPPYGRLRPAQYKQLIGSYKIMMWDLMAYDFDSGFSKEKSMYVLKKKIRAGSIIVLHDKHESTVHWFLEEFIIYCLSKGFRFDIPAFLYDHTD